MLRAAEWRRGSTLGRSYPPLTAQVRLSHQELLQEPSTEWQTAAASLLWLDYLILAEGPSIYFHPLIYSKKGVRMWRIKGSKA